MIQKKKVLFRLIFLRITFIKHIFLPTTIFLTLMPAKPMSFIISLQETMIFKNENLFEYIFGNISFIVLFIAVLLYWFDFSDTQPKSKKLKSFCMIGANLSLTILLLIRWYESGHFPLSNLYESLIGLSWGFTTIHVILTLDQPNRVNPSPKELSLNDKIGTITAPTALLTSVFATFFLPPEMLRATTLIPALKSNWLTMHVTLMVASYAFLLVGSLLSMAYCVYIFSTKTFVISSSQNTESLYNMDNPDQFSLVNSSVESQNFRPNTHTSFRKSNFSQMQISESDIGLWLNTTSYRILGLGFPLLTIGILSGAVWANEAWGSYWSWDPKETWALITWLVFAIYFHSRYNRSSDFSVVPASIASIGFFVIWICYLGVNLLGTGLHSYGWFGFFFFSFN